MRVALRIVGNRGQQRRGRLCRPPKMGGQVGGQVRGKVGGKVGGKVDGKVGGKVGGEVGGEVGGWPPTGHTPLSRV